MFPFGLMVIPFPIDSEENTGPLAESRIVIISIRGLTIISTVAGSSALAIYFVFISKVLTAVYLVIARVFC
ncbi:hypothetical protein NG881_13880 [Enterococcus faecalis]|nr:hypothetical protein [Enterococcus faecalis]MCO5458556.1 hypothetical protein [Enterococcus faecalis]MCO5513910.1 hypothetical protein [Enterococcus faecalis]MCO5519462.1 hypothetical protein [Enterococcus faecalis]MCO5529987.1 hypothetical protein [Enterococcus faecalis]